jgi:hypothetical protein
MKRLPSKILDGLKSRQASMVTPASFVARSLSEGLDYEPGWRAWLASFYHQEFFTAEQNGGGFLFPPGEKDDHVIQYFTFKTYGSCREADITEAIRWSERNHLRSEENMAKIRAMVVAGATDDYIAGKFFTKPENVATYVKLFFDVRSCLDSPIWMDTFIKPEKTELTTTPFELRELIWLAIGYQKGLAALEDFISGKSDYLSDKEIAALFETTKSSITSQGMMHAIGNTILNINGRPSELDRSLAMRQNDSLKAAPPTLSGDISKTKAWMDEAIANDIFSEEVASGIKLGEKTFLEASATKSPPALLTETKNSNTIQRSSVVGRLTFLRQKDWLVSPL